MNTRRVSTLVLMGLGLVAMLIATSCEQGIMPPNDVPVPPPEIVKATSIKVTLSVPVGASIASATVKLTASGSAVADTTILNPTDGQIIVFDDLLPTTPYSVIVTGLASDGVAILVQSALLTIVDDVPPSATLKLQPLEQTENIELKTEPVEVTGTTIVVDQTENTSDIADGIAPTEVAISGVSGNVTVANLTPSEAPDVVNNSGAVTTSVLGAVSIQAPPGGTATVTMSVPIDSLDREAAAGGTVDILSFNPTTSTWATIGTATIQADGTVSTTLTDMGDNTLIAIGTTPTVTPNAALATLTPVRNYLPAELAVLAAQGATELPPFETNPSIETVGGGKISIIPSPRSDITEALWQQIAPLVAAEHHILRTWIYDGTTSRIVPIPSGEYYIVITTVTAVFTIEFKFGNLLKTFTFRVTYTKEEKWPIIHLDSGAGTSDG
jgi:hypothetical protein